MRLAAALLVAPAAALAAVTPSPATVDFGGQSMNTTSPAVAVVITNSGTAAETIASVSATANFAVTHDCASLQPASSCTASVTFTPAAEGSLGGTLTVQGSAGTQTVALAGTGERSLVTHYYRAILRRAPDEAGKAFWLGESARLASLGANTNEAWYALAMTFFASAEYAGFNRDDAGFVTDLYATFFNRPPDADGLSYWTGQLASGLPREVALTGFLFSPEFASFTQAIFGNTAVRKEVDTVMDFYRGMLGRLPDSDGFNAWVGAFRLAQCQGAPYVYTQVQAISGGFLNSGEYAARNRTNAQFVGDLYNAFLRRGGELSGVQYWMNELASGNRTREQLRQAFVSSPEFDARVQAMIAEGCAVAGYAADFDINGNLIPSPSGPPGATMCEQPGQPPYPGYGGRAPCGSYEIPVGTCSSNMTGANAITRAFLYALEDYYPGNGRLGNSIRFGLQRDHAMVFRVKTGEAGLFTLPRWVTIGYEEQVNRGPFAPRFVTLSETRCDFDYSKTYSEGTLNGCYKAMGGGDALLGKIWAPGTEPTPAADFPYCPLKPNTTYYLNIRYEDASSALTRGILSCPAGVNAYNTCGQTVVFN